MIKHYFCKANAKFRLARYDEAIKDYTNAVIVYKEQTKNENETKEAVPGQPRKSKALQKDDAEEEYYSEKQIMFNEIYLNRAITYIKYAYELSEHKNYSEHANIITSYKMKACEDLLKYFNSFEGKPTCSEKDLRNHLLLFMHTDDPGQLIEVNKSLSTKFSLVSEEDIIKVYYSIKELNNCILTLKSYIAQLDHRL